MGTIITLKIINSMELPVSNKPTAYLKSSFILVILLVIFSIIYLNNHDISTLIVLCVIIISVTPYLIFSQKKQNINALEFNQNKLIVSYSKYKIEIPISQIQEITEGVNLGLNFKFKMIKTYTILLKKKYVFGDKLLIDYNTTEGGSIKVDPLSIAVLKMELQRLNRPKIT